MNQQNTASWKATVTCAGCGADLIIEPDRHYADCSHCEATNIVDLGGQATCFQMRESLESDSLESKVSAWLRAKGLPDQEINIRDHSFLLIPFWTFRGHLKEKNAESSLLAVDLADLPISPDEKKPPGQLEHFNPHPHPKETQTKDQIIVQPTVPLPAALARAGAEPMATDQSQLRISLVYVPYALFHYTYRGLEFEALIDASTGKVSSYSWPKHHDLRLDGKLAAIVALAVILFLGSAIFIPGLIASIVAILVAAVVLWKVLSTMITSPSKVDS